MKNVPQGRTSSATATIWPVQMGFVVSDDCLRGKFFHFKKSEEKEAIKKFESLSV